MKKILMSLALGFSAIISAQYFTTGDVTLGTTGITLRLYVDESIIKIRLKGSSTSYMAVGFNASQMTDPADAFIYNSAASRDYYLSGGYSAPIVDDLQNWTEVSNTVDVNGIRSIEYTRPKDTGEANDYVFTNTAGSLNIIYAKGASLSLAYHGSVNRGVETVTFNTTLATEEIERNSSVKISPNPTSDFISFTDFEKLESVQVLDLSGKILKNEKLSSSKLSIANLKSGAYIVLMNFKDGSVKSEKVIKK